MSVLRFKRLVSIWLEKFLIAVGETHELSSSSVPINENTFPTRRALKEDFKQKKGLS